MAAINTYSAMSALDGTETFLGVQSTAKLATGQQLMTLITGSTTLSGATVTTSKPLINMAQTWNDAGVAFVGAEATFTATAAAIGSKLLSLKLGAATQLAVTNGGTGSLGPAVVVPAGVLNSPGLSFGSANIGLFGAAGLYAATSTTGVVYGAGSAAYIALTSDGLSLRNNTYVRFAAGTNPDTATWDLGLYRKAAKVLEINSGTAGTYAGCALNVGTQTVAQLTAAATAGAGALAFVSDATATTPRSTVAGGGANKVLVMSDASNWLIVA